eukprot:gnl/MRDRNA2_/MRDRNA2_74048_c0_seq1.p1 gnl/MRDRNA2_/MRDRNA2_74048_c0~~gnl/MRDRNA2_/MRDRNA2_74048_c0_seq1.p1  ORF type:complete len:253 (+),score=41.10 gnl/MRDRNA2_/MRDRNA2_74048_c0_seq1:512-1270(+)
MMPVIEQRVKDFCAQDITNTAWAYARASLVLGEWHAYDRVFKALSREILHDMDRFRSQGISMIAWSFARAKRVEPGLFEALEDIVHRKIREFTEQDLANLAWAFDQVGIFNAPLYHLFSSHLSENLGRLNTQTLSNTMRAFAKSGFLEESYCILALRSAGQRWHEFTAHGIACFAWSFALAGVEDPEVWNELREPIDKLIGKFQTGGITNVAWAFAKARQIDAQFFDDLKTAALKYITEKNAWHPDDICNAA